MLTETEHKLKPSVGLSPERHIALGSTTRMVVPLSSSLSASTRPPCNCAMCFTIARPRPVPRTLSGCVLYLRDRSARKYAANLLWRYRCHHRSQSTRFHRRAAGRSAESRRARANISRRYRADCRGLPAAACDQREWATSRRNIDNHVELFTCEFLFPVANHFREKTRQIQCSHLQIGVA